MREELLIIATKIKDKEEGIRHQIELQKYIVLEDILKEEDIKYIGGADLAYIEDKGICSLVVLTYPSLELVEVSNVILKVDFPYIPGLLAFRELPPIVEAYKRLKIKPNILLVDGQGIAHPRKMGIATHLGIVLEIPTIGCAKSKLFGYYQEPGNNRGDFSLLKTKEGEVIGAVLRTKPNEKPIFISPGNYISLQSSLSLVLKVTKEDTRIPLPTLLAHNSCESYKKEILNKRNPPESLSLF